MAQIPYVGNVSAATYGSLAWKQSVQSAITRSARPVRPRLLGLPLSRIIHADAVLAGLPFALKDPDQRSGLSCVLDGADSVAMSGHEFIGSPFRLGSTAGASSPRNAAADRVRREPPEIHRLEACGHAMRTPWLLRTSAEADEERGSLR